jgi:hypothetical protein
MSRFQQLSRNPGLISLAVSGVLWFLWELFKDAVFSFINAKIDAYMNVTDYSIQLAAPFLTTYGPPAFLIGIAFSLVYLAFRAGQRATTGNSEEITLVSQTTPLTVVMNQHFKNRHLQLDNHDYVDCSFEYVTFEYQGGPWRITNCRFLTHNILTTGTLSVRGSVEFLKVAGWLREDFAASWHQQD